jgi:2-methylcitrate dehydratase
LLSVALLDHNVTPAQSRRSALPGRTFSGPLKTVSSLPNVEFTTLYPQKMAARITVRLNDGREIKHDVQDYPGLASRPFTCEESVEKFAIARRCARPCVACPSSMIRLWSRADCGRLSERS